MSTHHFLAYDFGAESGRAILSTLENSKLSLREIHRFPTGMLNISGRYRWNVLRLYEEMTEAMRKCAREGVQPHCIGIDTWGVDFVLLGKDGSMLGAPLAYRDPHTDNAMPEVFEKMSKARIYEKTGIAFHQFNSLYQLHAMRRDESPQLHIASDLLFIPDLFNYLFTGVKKSEFTFATTSQLYNPTTRSWDRELFEAVGVAPSIMQEIVQPGILLGRLLPDIQQKTGLGDVPVAAVASHDTGSAIVSIPATDSDFAYISSGTWSLMGVENQEAILTPRALECNFTNEGGAMGTFRFLKNIMGLWLLQETKRSFSRKGREYTYPQLVELSQQAKPFAILINPDDHSFYNPADMTEAIDAYCKKTDQQAPASDADYVRIIFDALALKYRFVLDQLKEVTGRNINKIHIIGGGGQNQLLCQFTANACQMPVVAGPFEATAIGNIMMQAAALGLVSSLDEIRSIIRNSFDLEIYQPQDTQAWQQAYERFKLLN